jgi:hypothetical protein
MPKILKELESAPPEVGFLGHNGLGGTIVQYWRSFDHLEQSARDRNALHWPAWVEFNRQMKEREEMSEFGTRPTRFVPESMRPYTVGCLLVGSAK